MKKALFLFFMLISIGVSAQQTGSFTVGGDIDKFYPVIFTDGGWQENKATVLEIGRSDVHYDGPWRGSMIAKLKFHTIRWGHGSAFVDAEIISRDNFIAGWFDATSANISLDMIIWLKGGSTTYAYTSNVATNPRIYDGVQNVLPFHEENGVDHTYKTVVASYVNPNGISLRGSAFFNSGDRNYFAGNVGIGTIDPKGYKLAVAGNAIAESVTVKMQSVWPDYVFEDKYQPLSLPDLEEYIKINKHLPEIPSAAEIKENGISLGDMNAKLLKKIEELTLYLIEKDGENKNLKAKVEKLDAQLEVIKKKLNLN